MAPDPDPEEIQRRVREFAEAEGLFKPGLVVVAVSGGQDSVCLLDVLRRLRPALRIELHVAHLNHMFRGAEAAEEAAYVHGLAGAWGLSCTLASIDVPAYRARHRLSRQVAARYARQRFLAGVAGRVGATQVAMGHTGDDAVETMLMNLVRGSGMAGLRGILPRRMVVAGHLGPALERSDWHTGDPPPLGSLPELLRPLLALSRLETEGYCRANRLDFRRDPSNLNTAYRRNWVRTELMPMLEREAPGARERLRQTANLLSEEYALVTGMATEAWVAMSRVRPGQVEFDLDTWSRLEPALQRHLVRRAVDHLIGSLEDVARVHIEAGLALIRTGKVGAGIDFPAGVRLEKGYHTFRMASAVPRRVAPPQQEPAVVLPVPGYAVPPGARVEASVRKVEPGKAPVRDCRLGKRWEAFLDADLVGPELLVRRRRPGDRIVPLGMEHSRKLQDLMVDEKIPRQEREAIPLVATPDQVVWVAGYRIDDRFKVTPATRRVLRLTLISAESEESF